MLIAVNTAGTEARGAEVTVDSTLHPPGSTMTVVYRGDWTDAQLRNPPTTETLGVHPVAGRSAVRVDLPPAGMLVVA